MHYSCLRSQKVSEMLSDLPLLDLNEHPREGDLVLVQAKSNEGVYNEVENIYGRAVRLYMGDVFVGVLGTRQSGTNVTGHVPISAIRPGDRLQLDWRRAVLVGVASGLPSGAKWSALELEVLGFPQGRNCRCLGLRDTLITSRVLKNPVVSCSG